MPLKERLAEGNEDALEDVDELDLAYLQRMKKSGMDEDLLRRSFRLILPAWNNS